MSTSIGGPGPIPGAAPLPPSAPPSGFTGGFAGYPLATGSDGLRRFENAHIQQAIDDALLNLEPDKHFVAVAHHIFHDDGTVVENVTKVSLVIRLPAGLSIAAGAYKDWSGGDVGAEGKIIFSPF